MINKVLLLVILMLSINATLILTNSYLLNDYQVGNMTDISGTSGIGNSQSYQQFDPDTNSYIASDTQYSLLGVSDFYDVMKSLGSGVKNLFFGTFTIGLAIGLPFIIVLILSIPMIILSAIGLFYLLYYGVSAISSFVRR